MLSPMMQCAGRIRVKDCPFGAPDGVASQFQLVDRHGHPVTKDVRIASIHQTDWQGRIELSSEPRTNYEPHSSDWWNYGSRNGWSVTQSAESAPLTGESYTRIQPSAGASGLGITTDFLNLSGQYVVASCFVSKASNWRYFLFYGLGGGSHGVVFDIQTGACGNSDNGIWDDCGMVDVGGAWLCWAAIDTAGDNGLYPGMGADMQGTVPSFDGSGWIDIFGLSAVTGSSKLGVYIPTPSGSPVTVTDYTHDGQGGITLGQVPEDGASLDWSGTARRAA